MPAWPGGECPDCGDHMPPNLITCQSCRALLNSDLEQNYVAIPDFVPLREVGQQDTSNQSDPQMVMESLPQPDRQVLLIPYRGLVTTCPSCEEELKVPQQFADAKVQCNRCESVFKLDAEHRRSRVKAVYIDCPHCQKRIHASLEYTNLNVACKHCGGAVHIEFA